MKNSDYNILIVDDDPTQLTLLEIMLLDKQYTIDCAADGKEAMEMLSRRQCHLVLTDLNMPVLDGYGLLDQVTKYYPRTKVVVMSANCVQRSSLVQLGAYDLLAKPFSIQELYRTVEKAQQEKPLEKPTVMGHAGYKFPAFAQGLVPLPA